MVEYERHNVLYTPSYRGDMLFILLEGRVRTYKGVDSREITLEMIPSGTLFGSVAPAAESRGAHEHPWAETLEKSSIGLLRRETFERLVRNNPEVGLRATQLLNSRLNVISNRMADIALKEVPARLASVILYMMEHEGVKTLEDFVIPTRHTHRHLGTMVGADRVAVTRAFTKLQESGAVELTERQIHIKDIEALKRIAGAR